VVDQAVVLVGQGRVGVDPLDGQSDFPLGAGRIAGERGDPAAEFLCPGRQVLGQIGLRPPA